MIQLMELKKLCYSCYVTEMVESTGILFETCDDTEKEGR
jgi:hypothetical protein